MNKLNLYVIRDEVSQDNTFVVTAKNDEEAYRNAKLALCSIQPNFVNTHTKDKRIVYVGSIDIDTAVLHAEASPVPLKTIEEIRLDLVHEIAVAKSQALDALIKSGVTKDKIKEARDLVNSFQDFDSEEKGKEDGKSN